MRLPRGGEVRLDADVELVLPDAEPDAAACPDRLRLRDLLQPEQLAEEAARGLLAAGWGRELDVVDSRARGREYAQGYTRRSIVRSSHSS